MKKLITLLCLTLVLFSCHNKSLDPMDFDSEIFIFNENINNFSETLPDKKQQFIFYDLQKINKTYEMKYKINEQVGLLLIFDNNERLMSISFGNIESNKSFQYSELGIVPTALILTILNADLEDENRKQIAEFLTNCNEDKTVLLSDKILGKIKMIKNNKSQRIDIYFDV